MCLFPFFKRCSLKMVKALCKENRNIDVKQCENLMYKI